MECVPGYSKAHADLEVLAPSPGARQSTLIPSLSDVTRHDDIGSNQSAPRSDQPVQQSHRGGERGVGHHREAATRQLQIARVGHDDLDAVAVATPQVRRPLGVELNGNHPRPCFEERLGQDTIPGTDVQDEVAGCDCGGCDDAGRPTLIESVPPPVPRRFGAHGTSP
jgi:hypothetical protein